MRPEKKKRILEKLNKSSKVFEKNYNELNKDIETLLKEKIARQEQEKEELQKELALLRLRLNALS